MWSLRKILSVDRFNSNVAARLAKGFEQYKNMDAERRLHMRKELERLAAAEGISRGVKEIVVQTLSASERKG